MNALRASWESALPRLKTGLASLLIVSLLAGPAPMESQAAGPAANQVSSPAVHESGDGNTASPIKHVIVIIGENRSFDHVFATYQPKKGERVDNLLSSP